ncbi:MAG: NB-ARC domain-containing protein [Microcoleaceae cyanobacterium]
MLEESIVLVSSASKEEPEVSNIGTGFPFYREKNYTYLLTCAHVVKDVGGEGYVLVKNIPAEIVAIGIIKSFDLAVLRVKGLLHIPLLQLICLSEAKDRIFQIAGHYLYGEEKKIRLQTVRGVLGEKTLLTQSDQRVIAWELLITSSHPLEKGYSGAPVVDLKTGFVLGVATNMEREGRGGLAISVEALKNIWSEMPPAISLLTSQENEDGYLSEFVNSQSNINIKNKKQNMQEAPAVDFFFGRTEELSILEKWIVEDNCRLVAIVGMGGIGKTNLSSKFCQGGIGKTDLSFTLAKKIQNEFEYVIWKSLRSAPPVEDILIDLIKFLSNQQEFNLPNQLEDKVSLLVEYLQAKRCLLILDNAERILKGEERAGQYLEVYESYGEVFRQVGTREHQSCLLITSREIPEDISQLEGKKRPVRI